MLRFFTVYGSWGRPDMALFKFTKNILSCEPIDVYNNGDMKRDFTHIFDITRAINLLIKKNPLIIKKRKKIIECDNISKTAPYRVVNIGNTNSLPLSDYISEIEKVLGSVAKKNYLNVQDGDLLNTHSDNSLLNNLTGFKPKISIEEGILEFVNWYKTYYKFH